MPTRVFLSRNLSFGIILRKEQGQAWPVAHLQSRDRQVSLSDLPSHSCLPTGELACAERQTQREVTLKERLLERVDKDPLDPPTQKLPGTGGRLVLARGSLGERGAVWF